MMKLPSTKPYFVRALYEWCNENGFTPYVSAHVDALVKVPHEHVHEGKIVLNISPEATGYMSLTNDEITFQARFGGVPRELAIPMTHVIAIYAKENGVGMAFELELENSEKQRKSGDPDASSHPPRPSGPPTLRVVK